MDGAKCTKNGEPLVKHEEAQGAGGRERKTVLRREAPAQNTQQQTKAQEAAASDMCERIRVRVGTRSAPAPGPPNGKGRRVR